MIIDGNERGTAGDEMNLICLFRSTAQSTAQVTLKWSGGSVGNNDGVIENITINSGVITKKTLIFKPLLTSHGATYTCQAVIIITSSNTVKTISERVDVIVKSK